MSVSADGKAWNVLAENVDVSHLNHNVYKGFYALRPALFAAGKGKVGFRDFRYRNAIPQEKDMGAYLMVFHRDETHSLYMAVSRDGYTFTAVIMENLYWPVIRLLISEAFGTRIFSADQTELFTCR